MFIEQNLPPLDARAREVSEALAVIIRAAIDSANGMIGFDEYMQMALYEPALGYYLGGAEKFGRGGDFVTAPELSGLFGQCIAAQCEQVLPHFDNGEIFEFGAGTGALAIQVLQELAQRECLPERYSILELSPGLQARQQAQIKREIPHLIERISWVKDIPKRPINGVILANEVLDAIPVKVLNLKNGTLVERCVTYQKDGLFKWVERPAAKLLNDLVERYRRKNDLFPGDEYGFEICVSMDSWINDLDRILDSGLALLIDYGQGRGELYGPSFGTGSLRVFFRHLVHSDPLAHPGVQDITATVDFTRVAESAVAAGLNVAGYADQASFLLGCGLDQILGREQASADEEAVLKLSEQAKTLLLPTKMGSVFKVIGLCKNFEEPLLGFSIRDDRRFL